MGLWSIVSHKLDCRYHAWSLQIGPFTSQEEWDEFDTRTVTATSALVIRNGESHNVCFVSVQFNRGGVPLAGCAQRGEQYQDEDSDDEATAGSQSNGDIED